MAVKCPLGFRFIEQSIEEKYKRKSPRQLNVELKITGGNKRMRKEGGTQIAGK